MVDSAQLVGSTIAGKYQVRRILGEGGMGAVFEAEHVEIGKRVAVKVITGEGLSSQEAEGRFRREARAASAVESDHIVQVFDVGRDERAGLFMVMEYLTGADLASRISQEGRLDTGTVLTVGVQVARGLAKAHAAGVIHRDLKPANIFLISRDDGSTFVKILDFGISKLSQEQDKPDADGAKLTRAGTAIGTPEYMSPEQVQGLSTIDGRSDVWSLGAVLYECLAGRSPFSGYDTYEQTVIAVVTQPTKPLEEVAPWVPLPVAAVIGKALRRDLAERFESCGAFGVALAAAAKEVFPDMAGSTVFNTGTGAAISSPVVFGSSETSSSAATVSAWPKVTSTATAPAVVLGSKGDADPSNPPAPEGDDDIAIPGVGARKGTGLPVGLIMAAAAIIALVFGAKSALEKSTQNSASAVAAPAPQGLVETKPLPASTPPARLPERPNEPVAVPGKDPGVAKEPAAAKPVASSNTAGSNGAVAKPVASSAPVGGAASKAVAAKDAPGKEGDLGVQEAPANPPNRKPTSGEVFGGVNLSDDY